MTDSFGKSKGFTLVETATAIFIFSVGILAVLIIFPLSLKIIRTSDLATKAVGLAQEKIEEVSSDYYDSISVGTANETLSSPFDMFSRQTVIDYVDPANAMAISQTETGIKKVTVTISWQSLLKVGQQTVVVNGLISKH